MRVQLRLTLDCPPDVAWDTLHAPAAMRHAMAPWLRFTPSDGVPLPERWEEGRGYLVRLKLLGLVPMGEERIELSSDVRGDTRILIDDGGPVAGALGVVGDFRHRMAVSPAAGARTLYRDRLDIRGNASALMWPVYWVMWQWRAARLKRYVRGLSQGPA